MRSGLITRLLAVLVPVAVVLAAVGGAWALTRSSDRQAPLGAALDAMPASTATVDFTDWTRLDGSLDDLALRDVITRSVLAPISDEMDERLGWGVRRLGWEAYARLSGGAVTVIGLGDVSVSRAERSLDRVGEPVGDSGDVWRLAGDADVSGDFAASFGWVRVVPSRGLLLGAPDRASLERASAAVDGSVPSLLQDPSVAGIARRLDGADSALLQRRSFLCADSPFGTDPGATGQLAAALDGGRLVDPRWGGRALVDGDPQTMVFAVAFGSPRTARQQAEVRDPLTRGAFVGRSGRVDDTLRDGRVEQVGAVLSYRFTRAEEGEALMNATGPVAFAGCAPRR